MLRVSHGKIGVPVSQAFFRSGELMWETLLPRHSGAHIFNSSGFGAVDSGHVPISFHSCQLQPVLTLNPLSLTLCFLEKSLLTVL